MSVVKDCCGVHRCPKAKDKAIVGNNAVSVAGRSPVASMVRACDLAPFYLISQHEPVFMLIVEAFCTREGRGECEETGRV